MVPGWSNRNTDVLLQLLQSTSQTELAHIRASLLRQITLDLEGSITVAVDHLCGGTAVGRLVLSFLASSSTAHVLQGLLQGNGEAEQQAERSLVAGIIKVLGYGMKEWVVDGSGGEGGKRIQEGVELDLVNLLSLVLGSKGYLRGVDTLGNTRLSAKTDLADLVDRILARTRVQLGNPDLALGVQLSLLGGFVHSPLFLASDRSGRSVYDARVLVDFYASLVAPSSEKVDRSTTPPPRTTTPPPRSVEDSSKSVITPSCYARLDAREKGDLSRDVADVLDAGLRGLARFGPGDKRDKLPKSESLEAIRTFAHKEIMVSHGFYWITSLCSSLTISSKTAPTSNSSVIIRTLHPDTTLTVTLLQWQSQSPPRRAPNCR